VSAAAAYAIPLRRRGAALADRAWGRRLLMSPGTADPTTIPPSEVRAMLAASSGATRIAEALETVMSADLRERLAALDVPVGVVAGEYDRVIPGGFDAVLAARPEAPSVRISGTGHIPMMERPEQFTLGLEEVLSRLG
jgi:pimeloyl-ACP methyl ester carboxylesterase